MFKFLAQNMRTYERHESSIFPGKKFQVVIILGIIGLFISIRFVFHIPLTIGCSYRHISIASVTVQLPSLSLPYLGSNQEHSDNSHPRSSVTHAEQWEQLLQVSERVTSPIETLLACTPLTSQPFHIGYTSLILGVDRLDVINISMLDAQRRAAGKMHESAV